MRVGSEALLKVVYHDGGYQWFRVGRDRNTKTIVSYFRRLPAFKYAKLYRYHKTGRGTGNTGEQIGAFGMTYTKGMFNF